MSMMPIKVKKKGKTRGRPSNAEIWATKIVNELYKKNQPVLHSVCQDVMIHGYGAWQENKNGTITRIDPKSIINLNKVPKKIKLFKAEDYL